VDKPVLIYKECIYMKKLIIVSLFLSLPAFAQDGEVTGMPRIANYTPEAYPPEIQALIDERKRLDEEEAEIQRGLQGEPISKEFAAQLEKERAMNRQGFPDRIYTRDSVVGESLEEIDRKRGPKKKYILEETGYAKTNDPKLNAKLEKEFQKRQARMKAITPPAP
jgi:hypothetical protein